MESFTIGIDEVTMLEALLMQMDSKPKYDAMNR